MQILLTQEEYSGLLELKTQASEDQKKKLQKFCTKVANTMPAGVEWIGKERPWGCILTVHQEWYCDSCPAIEVCPLERKRYSK